MSRSLPPLLSRLRDADGLPDGIPGLSLEEKQTLAQELRDEIIGVVAHNGGHLAPSLGVVELTLALLSVFDARRDPIIWDVGHQSYPWKILTGRADRFETLRRYGGISGFPRREESPCDHFGVGHASTSVSAALGMAVARDLRGGDEHVTAVIGDGALTGGLALEALNQAGGMGRRLIVILNDNGMSISKNVGAISLFLSRNLSRHGVMRLKNRMGDAMRSVPKVGDWLLDTVRRGETSFKSFFTPGMLYEAFGINYIGPVDGHDIAKLERHLEAAKVLDKPVLLHVRTQKGRGYTPAEENPSRFHGISRFDLQTGRSISAPLPSDDYSGPGFTPAFASALCDLAEQDERIVAITAAMPDGTGTSMFQTRFPSRFIDVGICEEHAVTLAAGLAARGMRPVVAIYSTFLQRAYDQIIHDVCLQKLPVTFCLDRAGLVGEDGPTHHGAFDLSWLRAVPGLSVIAPRDELDLRNCLATALSLDAPAALRYPRGRSERLPMEILEKCRQGDRPGFTLLPVGTGELTLRGRELCVMAVGLQVHMAEEAARRIEAESGRRISVFDARWVKPLPEKQILELARAHHSLLLVEENTRAGGFSSAVLELLADNDLLNGKCIRRAALPDDFVPHGSCEHLRDLTGLDQNHLHALMREMLDAQRIPERQWDGSRPA